MVAMGNLFYRDVKYLFEVVITIWMFATSVVYPVQLVGGKVGAVLMLNPMTPIIDAYRTVIIRGQLPGIDFAVAGLLSCLCLMWAWVVFHRSEFQFAENI
jgi:ABC-type polysaccharide/polyol phosphate export permease